LFRAGHNLPMSITSISGIESPPRRCYK
jgi:hypothetical protein